MPNKEKAFILSIARDKIKPQPPLTTKYSFARKVDKSEIVDALIHQCLASKEYVIATDDTTTEDLS